MKFYFILLSLISFSAYSQIYTIPTNGKPLTVKTCSGKVYDNGGASDVIQETDGTITIVPAQKGKVIRLEIDTLDRSSDDSIIIYQGTTKNSANLIGLPTGVYLKKNPIYYGSEKDGAITIQYKAKKSSWKTKGFSALITCIDKKVSFDFSAEKILISKAFLKKNINVYLLIPGQKEKAPAFKINLYYSKDNLLDKSDVLGSPLFLNNLSESAMNLNADTKIPEQLAAGDYYIIAQLDPGNFVTETNEGNNIIVSEIYKIEK